MEMRLPLCLTAQRMKRAKKMLAVELVIEVEDFIATQDPSIHLLPCLSDIL